jgi:hypothetical protein
VARAILSQWYGQQVKYIPGKSKTL